MAPFERNTRKQYSNHLFFGKLSHPINDRKEKRLNNFKVFRAEELKHPLLRKDLTYTLELKGERKRRDSTFFNIFELFYCLNICVRNNKRRHRAQFRYIFSDLWAFSLLYPQHHLVFVKDVSVLVLLFFHQFMLSFDTYHWETIIRANFLFLRKLSECAGVQKVGGGNVDHSLCLDFHTRGTQTIDQTSSFTILATLAAFAHLVASVVRLDCSSNRNFYFI